MQFTQEQLTTIADALQYSIDALETEFQKNKYSRVAAEVQRAVEMYGRIRRFNKLLKEVQMALPEPKQVYVNNVLLMAAATR